MEQGADDYLTKSFSRRRIVGNDRFSINPLKKLEPGTQRERSLKILEEAYADEIALLKKMPNSQDLLTAENADLLRQLNIAY